MAATLSPSGERISKMGYLYQQRVSERGKSREGAWKLYYTVLHGLTLRFYRDEDAEKDPAYCTTPPASLADPKLLNKAGFLDVSNCLLAIDYKSQRSNGQESKPVAAAGTAGGNERHNVFSLTCQDMSEYRFQAANKVSVMTWVAKIQDCVSVALANGGSGSAGSSGSKAGGAEDEAEEERDRVEALDMLVKSRVTLERKSRKASLRTRNMLSLMRTSTRPDSAVLAEASEEGAVTPPSTRTPKTSPASSPVKKPGNPGAMSPAKDDEEDPLLPDPRLTCLHEQLHAREQLLEQLEKEEEQFRGRHLDKTSEKACSSGSAFERCHFTTCIQKEYYLVPGYLSSAVSAGDVVTVYGRTRDGRWRCHFHRPGTALLHCAASGRPGYDMKVDKRPEASSVTAATDKGAGGVGDSGGGGGGRGKDNKPTAGNGNVAESQPPRITNPSLTRSIRQADVPSGSPKTDRKGKRVDVEITTSATTKDYPMVGCLPTSILQGLGDAERLISEAAKCHREQGGCTPEDVPLQRPLSSSSSQSSIPATERIYSRLSSRSSASQPASPRSTTIETAESPVPLQLSDILETSMSTDWPVESDVRENLLRREISVSAVRQLGLEIRLGSVQSSDEESDSDHESERPVSASLTATVENVPGTKSDEHASRQSAAAAPAQDSLSIESAPPAVSKRSASAAASPMSSGYTTPPISASAPVANSALDEDQVDFSSLPIGRKKASSSIKPKSRSRSTSSSAPEDGFFTRVTQFFGRNRGDSFELETVSEHTRRNTPAAARLDRRGSSPNPLATIDGSGESPGDSRKASAPNIEGVQSILVKPPRNSQRTVLLEGFQTQTPIIEFGEYTIMDDECDRVPNGTDQDPPAMQPNDRQVFISFIEPRSCAEKAGMVVGDAVLEVNGTSTDSLTPADVSKLFSDSGAAFKVKIKYTDGLRRHEVQSKLKALTERLNEKDEELKRVESLQEQVESGGSDVAAIRKKLCSEPKKLRFSVTESPDQSRTLSRAGMSLSEALWDSAMDGGDSEGRRLRTSSFSHGLGTPEPVESESSDDDDIITEEDAL
ncbi:uncharacterized protein LOC135817775 [Sycon ciliatum]|uniref:uncharacterized protein LOC135817775 n=1 Tax=Sycon ciliatum TaxID=27933 RepID=UPI0031F5FB86